jgi:hypothetical protein
MELAIELTAVSAPFRKAPEKMTDGVRQATHRPLHVTDDALLATDDPETVGLSPGHQMKGARRGPEGTGVLLLCRLCFLGLPRSILRDGGQADQHGG